jgi:hypothetical protein
MRRREALVVIGAAALPAAERLFFTAEEYSMLERLVEAIIPADEVSPGAREAGVAAYIDKVVAHSETGVQARWREGLASMKTLDPTHAFFPELRRITLSGYYTSETGLRKDLGFQGNAVLHSFPGCSAK